MYVEGSCSRCASWTREQPQGEPSTKKWNEKYAGASPGKNRVALWEGVLKNAMWIKHILNHNNENGKGARENEEGRNWLVQTSALVACKVQNIE